MLSEHASRPSRPMMPKCPACGGMMMVRVAKVGKNAGQPFYGCCSFPDCRGTLPKAVGDAILAEGRAEEARAQKEALEKEFADLRADDLGFLAFLEP
ncbi:DNA topoisomerase, type IA, zn finger [uncultured Caudovirales phage]|uniref:DNA topoisomerase, type IA, zn finger n=1 Tax=uncultured Caudovirales phage TaxID=2100421 RepID=A0A6J5S5F2_9CAUD|nr:DNA topoisomerase, type IA, zn finger [uncultured Caudovirales phage]